MQKTVTVTFIPLRHCLVNLPPAWANALLDQGKLSQNVVVELSWQDGSNQRKAYVGWSGGSSNGGQQSLAPGPPRPAGDVVEMDPQFGHAIGLRSGQKVNIDFVRTVQDGISVNVAPYSEDDWEILELHAGYVEDQMLNQIRILYPHQIFTMWVNGRTLVRLKVLDINPVAPCVKLGANAEIIVAPMVRNANAGAKTSESQELNDLPKLTQAQCLRVLKLEDYAAALGLETGTGSTTAPFTALVNPESWTEKDLSRSKVLKISLVAPPHAEKGIDEETRDVEDAILGFNGVFAHVISSGLVPKGHVAVSKQVQAALDLANFSLVRLSESRATSAPLPALSLRPINTPGSPSNSTPAPLKLQAHSSSINTGKADKLAKFGKAFQSWINSLGADPVVLTHGALLTVPAGNDTFQSFTIHFPTKSLPHNQPSGDDGATRSPYEPEAYSIQTKAQLSQLKIEYGQPRNAIHLFKQPKTHLMDVPTRLGGVTQVFDRTEKYLLTCLSKLELRDAFAVPSLGKLLLCGPHGSGKTVVARTLIQRMAHNPETLAHCVEINCAEYAEDRLPLLMTKFHQWFETAAFHSPSILFLEDIDRLIPAEVEHADSFRSRQIAEVFLQIATKMSQRFDRLAVVATCQQQASVHPSLINSHLFSETVRLMPPGKQERREMLEAIMTSGPAILQRSLPHIDLVSVASKTEGYLAADLKAFVERTVHEGAVRNIAQQLEANVHAAQPNAADGKVKQQQQQQQDAASEQPPQHDASDFTLTLADFLKAQEGFVPSGLRGVKLQSSATSWADIGGLTETRETLLETLEWPTKYASIFSQCPLRLRSGLLLFGHPGCGKTLLASAVAKECGLNFISVKGPELLNKYIGASEKSVRDLFERAQAAKPCVLFFDEFDSIAPKRGHDSTGVTDRVVNQMLTQMDGAEGLDGVYVLAATSRPDLIDPALLRPGRLDKSLLCGMPSLKDRHEILECLSKKMEVGSDVDLLDVARRTEGLTGADLQAVLYNAHLEAIRLAIETDEAIKKERAAATAAAQQQQQQQQNSGTSSPNGPNTNTNTKREDDGKMARFVSLGGRGMAAGKAGQKANLTLAERGHISQRLGLIRKGLSNAQNGAGAGGEGSSNADGAPKSTRPIITAKHLEVSLANTRPSITPEESHRLDLIYNEFMGDRNGEMSNGTGSHELGQRATLA
ncbi:Peroxisome biosynthesis protein pex1 [Actinomortierella ambigua]|uniref:Peroxisomal ATPase PEX1 n=1 Tax=Actinomortierella ambigua TaxID=1343610 RepID=A0A9P6PYR4_9FUNG|nr:Peroxisome biosynthesis protein pex1 [Actinomortierella ambigua]